MEPVGADAPRDRTLGRHLKVLWPDFVGAAYGRPIINRSLPTFVAVDALMS